MLNQHRKIDEMEIMHDKKILCFCGSIMLTSRFIISMEDRNDFIRKLPDILYT